MSDLFDNIKVSRDIEIYVNRSFEISDYIFSLLQEQNMTIKDLAIKLKMKHSKVSNWFTGIHDFKLTEIAKIEAILNKKIITTNSEFTIKYNKQ